MLGDRVIGLALMFTSSYSYRLTLELGYFDSHLTSFQTNHLYELKC